MHLEDFLEAVIRLIIPELPRFRMVVIEGWGESVLD